MQSEAEGVKVTCRSCANIQEIDGCTRVGRCAVSGKIELLRPEFVCPNYKKVNIYKKRRMKQ